MILLWEFNAHVVHVITPIQIQYGHYQKKKKIQYGLYNNC